MPKTILMTGATGLIGGYILNALINRGDDVIVLSTHVEPAKKKLKNVKRIIKLDDYLTLKDEKIDVIINLAGANVGDKRWNDEFKKVIYDSRIDTTRKMVELVSSMSVKPEVLINSSGIDFYGDTGDRITDENSPYGNTFLGSVCKAWEAEAFKASEFTRVAVMRTGFVMAKGSEAVKRLSLPYKFFVGGSIGSGKQYMPWIHIDDVIGIFLYTIDNLNIKGSVNVCAPNPEQMKEFSKHLSKAMGRPSIFPVPSFVVKLVAGQMAEVILKGRRTIPKKITNAGYKFKFEHALEAWEDIFAKR